jgi:predicted metal-dependent phosphoesterase TrpH
VIDLHLHTTASDGLLAPAALVERAAGAGLTTIAITDHDTIAGIAEARAAGVRLGIDVVAGIEITAVEDGADVHILGYFLEVEHAPLAGFLSTQRADRIRRVREIGARLASLGYAVDVEALLEAAGRGGRSIGRPAIADALVAAGHAADRNDAFARLLGSGRPAFVPRAGMSGATVVQVIHDAGGVASLAHPGLGPGDFLIEPLAAAGLDAIEVWHCDHTPEQRELYFSLAERLGLARSGGSDFHGDAVHRSCRLGGIDVPRAEFTRLRSLARVSR